MKEKAKLSFEQIIPMIIKLGLLLLSLVGAIKMIFFGLEVDEEYAVVMSYRMVTGDAMLLDMWEPHQTSGFVCALFIKLFMMFFESTDYLIIYLRIVGVLLQAAVSLFIYYTIRKYYSKEIAFWAAILSFSLLPKWIQIPEFSNILLWSNLCTMLCLLRFAKEEKRRHVWLILAAIFYCMAILAYPTCLLLVPVYLWGIGRQYSDRIWKNIFVFFGTCAVIGGAYILYFLSHMSMKQFLFGIRQMSTDGHHDYTFLQRLGAYGEELSELLPQAVLVMCVAGVVFLILHFVVLKEYGREKKVTFMLLLIMVSHIHQFIVWNGEHMYMNEPLLFFYFSFVAGLLFVKSKSPLVYFGILPTALTMLAVLLITNTSISVTGANLLPGIIAGGVFAWEYMKERKFHRVYKWMTAVTGIIMIGLLMFAKGYLVCENEGLQADIFYVKQKALSGPAKGIYCRYLDGYSYNALAEVVDVHISEADRVLYVGNHNLRYMLSEAAISTYSTISTPTYDERLLEYWELYPQRYPTIVIEETGAGYTGQIEKLLTLSEPIAESADIRIYRVIK